MSIAAQPHPDYTRTDRATAPNSRVKAPSRKHMREQAESNSHPPTVVIRAKHGSREAFGEIYVKHLAHVQKIFWNRLHGVARRDIDDLVQEVFARAWKHMSGFEWQGKDIGAWLTVISCNLVRDYLKSGFVRIVTVSDTPVPLNQPCTGPDPQTLCLQGHDREVPSAAFDRLTAKQRTCLFYRYYVGMTIAETAEVMGIDGSAVKALAYRGAQTLTRLVPAEQFLKRGTDSA